MPILTDYTAVCLAASLEEWKECNESLIVLLRKKIYKRIQRKCYVSHCWMHVDFACRRAKQWQGIKQWTGYMWNESGTFTVPIYPA